MSYRNYYDSSNYGRNRESGRSVTSSTDRPTAVTAKYISTPSYKSSSIPILNNQRLSTKSESTISSISDRYSTFSNKHEKPSSKYDKRDYKKLTVPAMTTGRSRDVSPVTVSSKYGISRSSRPISPETRTIKSYKDKTCDSTPLSRDRDIPKKAEKSTTYSLNNYKPYTKTSTYTRPTTKLEPSPEVTVNRYANRLLSTSYLKSSPTNDKGSSVSPVNYTEETKIERSTTPIIEIDNILDSEQPDKKCDIVTSSSNNESCANEAENETITVVTRHTSPTPPGSSVYVRTRRADMAKTIERTITRPKIKPVTIDKEIQSDRLDDTSRSSRFVNSARISNWSLYTPNANSYTGYAGRYSTQYSNLRDNSNNSYYSDRSSRSTSKEPQCIENNCSNTNVTEYEVSPKCNSVLSEDIREFTQICEENKEQQDSEIIINVNLKLKKTKSPTELVSPEITITNSQLPPQAPKQESPTKTKKNKVKKSSADSSSDSSSKKKIIKRRSKSVSSTESDLCSESSENTNESNSPPKLLHKSKSKSNSLNKQSNIKKGKSQSSDQSPDSSSYQSTQSSISEDDTQSKSKTRDVSRTSADELSIPTDQSAKGPIFETQKHENGTEEAKSFLIRALAPVTNLFKLKSHDNQVNHSTDRSTSESTGKDISNLSTESDKFSKSKSNTENIIASNEDNNIKLKTIRHIESGERAWWLESSTDKKSQSNETPYYNTENYSSDKPFKKFIEDEKPWWQDSCANIPEGVERLTPPQKTSNACDESEKYNFFKVRRIESGDQKDWWLTSNENSSKSDTQNSVSKSNSDHKKFPMRRIRHIESGERPWWQSSGNNIPEGIEKLPTPPPDAQESDSSDSEEVQVVYSRQMQIPPFPLHLPDDEPLGDRRSPEGLEMPMEKHDYGGRASPYENNIFFMRRNNYYKKGTDRFISRCTDIDDILGTSGQIYSPFLDSILARRTGVPFDEEECKEIDPTQVRIHDSTPQRPVIKKLPCRSDIIDYQDEDQLDDSTLQVFKDGDYGPYLDLDSTLGEQDEELEGLQDNRKNAIVLRTQLPVRVHAIIERLQQSQGRELRRTLFTLKQILQSDKDLVHEFVANKGLDCLMQIGSKADHNILDYVLRALGQILLYVDGMHGVMKHTLIVQWLYTLISSVYRHVVKTTLKLLVVFADYTERNCLLLIEAITAVDTLSGRPPWHNIMKILKDFDASDTELLIYATTLINRCLNNIPERNMYYDQVDVLLDQGMDDIVQLYMTRQGTDLDLLRQLQIFEAVLLYEDGDESGLAIKQLDETIVSSLRRRSMMDNKDRRKSKRQHSTRASLQVMDAESGDKLNTNKIHFLPSVIVDNKENKDFSTAQKKRRDRHARQAHHITQQQEMLNNSYGIYNGLFINNHGTCSDSNDSFSSTNSAYTNTSCSTNSSYTSSKINTNGLSHHTNRIIGDKSEDDSFNNRSLHNIQIADAMKNGNQKYTSGLKQRIHNGTLGHSVSTVDALAVIRQKQLESTSEHKDDRGLIINREHSIKDLAQRLTSPINTTTEDKPIRVADMTGIVLKAKEELARSQSKEVIKSPVIEKSPKLHDVKMVENDLHWEELKENCLNSQFYLCDLDFSDLKQDSDDDIVAPTAGATCVPPPPPPVMFPQLAVPPPPPGAFSSVSNTNSLPSFKSSISLEASSESKSSTIKKNKKTVKLFWREINEHPIPISMREKVGGMIWDELPSVALNTKILEHLFESRSNDLIIKKVSEPKKNLILDAKRSNAINIAMKKLPTPNSIKTAILKMDSNIIGRESIEMLLNMLPTEDEKIKIQEAQYANPGLPLGSAEQFLLTLASITDLSSRLKLWVFKLDFDNLIKEIAEPLMDLKHGVELLKTNQTFKVILSTLRSVGSFLNGADVKGFRLEYLAKVMEVKDTVHKHPLLHHICEMIIDKFPDTTDFFSEVGPVIRASKIDFEVLEANLIKLESDCKSAWEHMKRISKHDSSPIFKTKTNEFIINAAEKIIMLSVIKRKVFNRFAKFLIYIGVPPVDLTKTNKTDILKIIAEFALEYRTCRERVLQQKEKKANHRERNKTRGKMIMDVGYYSAKNGDHAADIALKELLKTNPDTDSLTESRRKAKTQSNNAVVNGDLSPEDEIIESLVRSAASRPRPVTRERRKNRLSDKQNLNRTLNGHS